MARVRGSKQEKLLVKPHRPLRRVGWFLALLLLILAALAASFLAGRQHERQMQMVTPGERQQLERLQRQIAAMERDQQVDLLAVETSRKSIEALEQEISQLNKSITFYRSIMEPQNGSRGLQVHNLGLERIGSGRYRVNWVLAQVGKSKKVIEGRSDLSFSGISGSEKRVLSLKEVAETEVNTSFKFRYFQHFDAVVNIPEEMQVVSVEVTAQSNGKDAQVVSREFEWVVQETLADVGE